jgi:hypothetical protein
MEDDLHIVFKGRQPQFFLKMEQDPKKVIQPKTIKSKNNNILKMEDDFNFH